ncbi:ABC transporter permease [Eremococcus coleocola]|uniref:ABC transporter, permease protein n=1 Tax=Eremococcus coleocola ACS-139-V-Col8 TaxID=908337 RepID=E4KNQ4_9LACT|nr:ABC transporter permease [Eremococcus coleocola]EFR31412.1 ABC transporter, permease protein [Eremococcus coleocola ACS-139-V-Col8]
MNRKNNHYLAIPYYLWIAIFVIAPILLLIYRSLFDIEGHFTLNNYLYYFTSANYLIMTVSSFVTAFLVTAITLLLAYPFAYLLTKTKRKNLWLLLVILPTWINLLLKIYAFIGILSKSGPIVGWLEAIGFYDVQLLFTNTAFILVAVYVELPFMVLPIFNSIDDIPDSLMEASLDLGANSLKRLQKVIFPLSIRGVKSGVQAVFIPSLSLFMLTRLIGGNRVITLGTAVEQHFLVTQNWGMGATIGVILLLAMILIMYLTRDRHEQGGQD